ncbi:tubulin nucleotide-binding domain-like protein [Artomyces pyxidatus]|uniref:Tubulin nucleotide-binding domain-like protein n=1 Tax=Artomyces pyxidatus TaxID=48021 RepID=A0ACB8T1I1_9AGAM|nr:tubulin nucleotide-binding domain-like protein [Artomyces pyxidatus]
MREIIYIQAGNFSNYIGTHFWNTQQSYFTYSEDDEVLVDHDVSFREGVSPQGQPTFCPRLIQFDQKANYGTLSNESALYRESEDVDASSAAGPVDEIRQDPIPESTYQSRLDEEIEEDSADNQKVSETPTVVPALHSSEIRYWSDYNRVYYLPRSVHKLPDIADWEIAEGRWQTGKEVFNRYDVDNSLMEGSFRLFVEECDTFQGVQLLVNTDSFGSFAHSLLTVFRDEFPKLPSLTFPILSDVVPGDIDVDDVKGMRKALNDALFLRGVYEISTMNVPLESPELWKTGVWSAGLAPNFRSPYEASAVLSAHVETATLPLRMKASEPLYRFCDRLNLYGNTPFVELSGVFPATVAEALDPRTAHNYTHADVRVGEPLLSRRDVTRGFTEAEQRQYDAGVIIPSGVSITSLHSPIAYPLPTSYPSFFREPHLNDASMRTSRGILSRPRSAPILSSLGLSGVTRDLFTRHASFLDDCVRRKVDWQIVGIDVDEARDLRDEMWALRDNFGDANSDEGGDELGEDEEVS